MVILKKLKNLTDNDRYLESVCRYVMGKRAIKLGGNGVNYFDAQAAIRQMMYVQEDFGKVGLNPIYHFIVGYEGTVREEQTACRYTEEIAKFFQSRHQYVYCTHRMDRGCPRYHAHIAVNACSFVDGRMLRDDFVKMDRFCNHIRRVTGCLVRQVREDEE